MSNELLTNSPSIYFELLFGARNSRLSIENEGDYWVFWSIATDRLSEISNLLRKDLKQASSLPFNEQTIDQTVNSLIKQLEFCVGPVLQAEYRGFIQKCIDMKLISENINNSLEIELKQRFLDELTNGGIVRIFQTMDFLKVRTNETIDNWLKNSKAFYERFEKDQVALLHRLDSGTTENDNNAYIESIQTNLSDPHNGHQMVILVKLSDGQKLAYKPRSLSPERSFYEWISLLNKKNQLPTKLYAPWVLDMGMYGWMEFVTPLESITDSTDQDMYAKQFGTLCVLWYLIGGSDLHKENVLFGEKGVVIIDCETIFDDDFKYHAIENIKVRPMIEPGATHHTILSTGALSTLVSDLGVDNEVIEQIGGVTNYLGLLKERFHNDLKPTNQQPHNKSSDQHDTLRTFTRSVCDGIEGTIAYFNSQNLKDATTEITNNFKTDVYARVLLRPTSSYASMLRNLWRNYKSLQTDNLARTYITSQLNKAKPLYSLFGESNFYKEAEISQLKTFNVPYFKRKLGSNTVILGSGLEIKLEAKIDFSSTNQRLNWLRNTQFAKSQTDLAELAIMPQEILQPYVCINPENEMVKEYYRWGKDINSIISRMKANPKTALSNIAGSLIKDIEHADDTDHSFYTAQLFQHENAYSTIPMSYSLFQGLSGKFLFLGLYASISKNTEIINFINDKAQYFIELSKNTSYVKENCRYGADLGYQSLIYVFTHLKKIGVIPNPEPVLSNFLDLFPSPQPNDNYDLMKSVPGNILIGGSLNNRPSKTILLSWGNQLKTCMKSLMEDWDSILDRDRVGVAHGALGSCLAASSLIRMGLEDQELKNLTLGLIDLESQAAKNDNTMSWCRGIAGRALTYHSVGQSFGIDELVNKARKMVSLTKNPVFSNHSLCCGSLGYIAAHLTVNGDLDGYQNPDTRVALVNDFYHNPEALLKVANNSSIMPTGLFYGQAGLGLVMLYAMRPDIVPAVWAFE